MARIVVSEFLTLDGVMQGPGDPNEDRSDGFERGGWQLPYFDETFGRVVLEGFAQAGGLLLGRRTYDIFAAYWPNQPADDPVAGPMNTMTKHVVSTTLSEPLAWANSRLIRNDVPAAVQKLRDAPGQDILVIGSGGLAQTLIANDLIDAYQLMIHPLVLGDGKRLFRETPAPLRLRLVDSQISTTGVLIATYEPDASAPRPPA